MGKLANLTKRNRKLYFASRSNIFFSMLALIILIGLHFVVFRGMNADSLLSSGVSASEKWALWFSDCLMLSSLIPIGAITISLTSLGQIVTDKERNIIHDFYAAPVSKTTLLLSYLLSSLSIGAIMLTGFIVLFQVYLTAVYGISFTLIQLLAVLGVSALSLLLGNSFVLLIVSFVKREQAMGAIGTILGTMLGFLGGAYVPVGVLGEGVGTVFTCMPFLPLTTLARQSFFMNISSTGLTGDIVGGELARIYGYELFLAGEKLSYTALCLIAAVYTAFFGVLLFLRFKHMRKTD
ncbi:ABC transporter permease [Anaerolentibacter hominis]|uniref:ABC transporter permease n=1 Tax=Anaerolentibacter hominis TaxID=3079009 RepID=UPI0031B891CA